MENNFFGVTLFGEDSDSPINPTKTNTVIISPHNKLKLALDATWVDWKMAIIFPDDEKADYFLNHFKTSMSDYREGMMKDDYRFHILHLTYPKPERLYAVPLRMTKGWSHASSYD